MQSHEWIEDSLFEVAPLGGSATHITYSNDNTATFTHSTLLYKNPFGNVLYNASYSNPDKVYYWMQNSSLDTTVYLTIQSVTATKLVTLNRNNLSGIQSTSYYHAK